MTQEEKKAAEEAAAAEVAAKKAAEEAAKGKVTFLGMRHFNIGDRKYSTERGTVLAINPSSLKHLIEGKSLNDTDADFVRGEHDTAKHDASKKK